MSNEQLTNEQTENPAEQTLAPEQARSDLDETPVEQAAQPATDEPVKDEPVESAPQPQKPERVKAARTPQQKRKLFGLIYYPVLALFVVLMLIFSALDGAVGYNPGAYSDGYYTAVNAHIKELSAASRSVMSPATDEGGLADARDYIVSTLTAGGFTSVAEVKTERDDNSVDDRLERIKTVTGFAPDNGATVTLQTSTLDADLQSALGLSEHLAGRQITNVIAAIPSAAANKGAVIITVRYDGRNDSVGAASNGAFVANAVQSLIEINKSGAKLKNDIVVVFTEDLDYSYGAYAFFNLFDGMDGVVSRATAGVNLEAYGNAGTLALTDASNAGLDYIYAYTKTSGTALNTSVVPSVVPSALVNRDAVKAFGDIPAVQVAVIGGLDAAQSPLDTADNVSQSVIKQQARFIKDYVQKFGNSADKYGADGDDDVAIFSYLDGGTIAYPAVASYVVGAVILALIAGVVVAMAVKKTFSIKNMFVALGVQLLVIASTLAALVAAYFLTTLMLTGFGVLPIHAITQLTYINAGIIIAAIIITVAATFGFTTLYKKLFRVTSSECVRGTAILFGLAGAVMSFACPAYSFITSWLGLLMLAVLLVSVLLHKDFKSKFGFGMDRLYLYAIPVALCLPLIMPELIVAASMLKLVLLPVLFTIVTAMLGVAVPYLDRTQPVLDKLAKKLPKRTIRVERTVTEKIEDRAKKGKFTERTVKRVEKEKVAVNYKNYFGISVAVVLGVVIALFSGGFGVNFNKTLTNYYSYGDEIYNDSLVYELVTGSSDTATQRVVVGDLMAYKFIRYNVSGLEWNGEKNRYEKSVNYNVNEIIARNPAIEKNNGVYTVTTFDGARSNVKLTIPSARSITKITVKEFTRTDGDYEGYVYEYDNQDEIVLRLPYGFDTTFTLEIEGASPTTIEYEERRSVTGNDVLLDIVDEWNQIRDSSDMPGLRAGIVLKRTFSI